MRTSAIAAIFLLTLTASAQNVPDIKPGDTCEKLRAAYGKESSQEGPAHIWKQDGVEIRVLVKPGGPCVAGSVEYSIQPGHTFRTRDGIVLGRDTMADAGLKLRGRISGNNYVFLRGEGKAYGQIEAPPTTGFPYKGTYSWQLNQTVAAKLNAPPKLTDFTNEPVTFYSIDAPDPQ